MRIIGYIDHPTLKITIFELGNRMAVKFETGLYEQTYKFRKSSAIQQADDIRRIVSPSFIDQVDNLFTRMDLVKQDAMQEGIAENDADEFDKII